MALAIATTSSGTTASGTSHTVTLPSGIASGDYVEVHFRLNTDASITPPGGWNVGAENESMLFDRAYGVYWRRCDGTEGASITITTGGAATGGYTCYRITGGHATSDPEFSTVAVAETNTPNPPSKTASWGAEENLFVASFGGDAVLTTTAYPTDFALSQITVAGTAAAARLISSATQDPGTFTTTGGPAVHGSVTSVYRPAAGGAFSLDAAPGSYALTGAAVGAVAARLLNAAVGSYALTGLAASFLHGFMLNAGPGAYALTGTDATLLAARLLNAAAGAYTLTGAAAPLLAARVLEAGPGTYLLTGADADLLLTPVGAFTLNAEPGVYALTGPDGTLLAARLLVTEAGTYAITGADADLVFTGGAALTGKLHRLVNPTLTTVVT